MNIYGYIKEENRTFAEKQFNAVDALVFAWLAYFDFEPIKELYPLPIKAIKDIPYYQKLGPYYTAVLARPSKKIMMAMSNSPRFQNVEILESFSLSDKKLHVQFGAIAVRFNNQIVVAFRGTDLSYTGWREDFALSFKDSIHSYSLAASFLGNVVQKYQENIILCGHSKGGHLCTYLLSELEDDSRIDFVYSFDGPGFRTLDLFKGKEERLNKFVKIIPQSSFVGVLFSNETEMQIIKSRNVMLLQHNPLEWLVKNGDFIYLKKRAFSSKYLEKAVNSWINSLDEKERERFTEIVFGELDKLEAKDFKAFFLGIFKQIKPLYKAYRHLEKEDRKLLFHVMKKLIRNLIKPEKKKIA